MGRVDPGTSEPPVTPLTPAVLSARRDLLDLATGRRPWASPLGEVSTSPGPGHRRSAVLLLFGLLEDSDHAAGGHTDVDLLLTRRSDALRHHPGQVAFPGGGIDPGEGPQDAAVREAVEETGLLASGVEVLGSLPDVPVVVSGNVVTPVLAWWAAPSPLTPDGVETSVVFRVPVSDLLSPANRGTVVFRGVHRSPAFAVGGQIVWGFTAMVLDAVLDSLGWTVPWDATREIELP